MYFLQEAGEPLRLRYVKALYGPYAENLRHVLREVEGHLITGYSDGGEMPDKQLALVPGAVEDAQAYLTSHADVHAHFDRVVESVQGFETPYGLELLATVHWIAVHEGIEAVDEVIAATYAWDGRKRRFTPAQIGLAFDILQDKRWIGGH